MRDWLRDAEIGIAVGIGFVVVFLAVVALIWYSALVNH